MEREKKIQEAVHASEMEWRRRIWDKEREKHAQHVHSIIYVAMSKAEELARVVQDAVMADAPRGKTLRDVRIRCVRQHHQTP